MDCSREVERPSQVTFAVVTSPTLTTRETVDRRFTRRVFDLLYRNTGRSITAEHTCEESRLWNIPGYDVLTRPASTHMVHIEIGNITQSHIEEGRSWNGYRRTSNSADIRGVGRRLGIEPLRRHFCPSPSPRGAMSGRGMRPLESPVCCPYRDIRFSTRTLGAAVITTYAQCRAPVAPAPSLRIRPTFREPDIAAFTNRSAAVRRRQCGCCIEIEFAVYEVSRGAAP